MFARADGALGTPWTGATYGVDGYTATNTPTLGGEILTNDQKSLDGTYTAGVAAGWTAYGSGTPAEELVKVHGGTKSQKLTMVANNDRVVVSFATTVGARYHISAWVYKEAGTVLCYAGATNSAATYLARCTPTGAWTKVSMTVRATTATTYFGMWLSGAGSVGYIDDVSVEQITVSTTLATFVPGRKRFSLHTTFTSVSGEWIGLAIRWNAALTTGIVVYFQPDNSKLFIDKCISGAWSNVYTSGSLAPNSAYVLRVDQDGNQIKVYYNGALVTTTSISIPVTALDKAGMFNSGPNGFHTSFAITPYAGTPYLPLYVATGGVDANPGSLALPRQTLTAVNSKANNIYMVSDIIAGAGTWAELCTVPRQKLVYTGAGLTTIIDGGTVRNGISAVTFKHDVIVQDFLLHDCVNGVLLQTSNNPIIRRCKSDGASNFGFWINASYLSGIVEDCESVGAVEAGFYAGTTPNVQFTRCYAHDAAAVGCYLFASFIDSDNNVYTDCWALDNCNFNYVDEKNTDTRYIRCVAAGGGNYGIDCEGSIDSVIDHCVIHGTVSYGLSIIQHISSGRFSSGIQVRNTVFMNNDIAILVSPGNTVGFSSDYNCFYGNSHIGRYNNVTYDTLAEWQAATGQDLHSVEIDPEYTDETYPDGFKLQAGSPLLTAGEGGTYIGIDGTGTATPPGGYSPSMDFSETLNSMYLGAEIL